MNTTSKRKRPQEKAIETEAIRSTDCSVKRPKRAVKVINQSSFNIVESDGLSSIADQPQMDKPKGGLRHFSMKVCSKVEEKGCTTYNEVADELVQDMSFECGKFDHKNIRRRVYDALNVLMAMDIIKKDKKQIKWLGLPTNAVHNHVVFENDKVLLEKRLLQKRKQLIELVQRQVSLKKLIEKNMELTRNNPEPLNQDILSLPFILICAPKECRINCEMLEDRTNYAFDFDMPFTINEDIEVLKLLSSSGISAQDLSEFPADISAYVSEYISEEDHQSACSSPSIDNTFNSPQMFKGPIGRSMMNSAVMNDVSFHKL